MRSGNPDPSTQAHTGVQAERARNHARPITLTTKAGVQAETQAQPQTPQTPAGKRGATPQTVPKYTHPRPQPGLAGLPKPTPNHNPDPNKARDVRKHGGTPSRRDKHVTLAAISPPGDAQGRFVGGQQPGLAGCKSPPLFKCEASSCSSQRQRQREPWSASPRPSAPAYLPIKGDSVTTKETHNNYRFRKR